MFSRTGEKPFRVNLEISRSTFSDYDSFVHSMVNNARLKVDAFDEDRYTYYFSNQWKCTLSSNSSIILSSPFLNTQAASEVTRLVNVLGSMNVKVGETCKADIQYERWIGLNWFKNLASKIPLELSCGFWLVLFLVLKTLEFQLQVVLIWQATILLQCMEHLCVGLFTVALYKMSSKKRRPARSLDLKREDQRVQPTNKAEIVSFQTAPSAGGSLQEELKDVIDEIRDPVDHIMAYARFYQNASDSGTQQGKDLVELMEQAIRLQDSLRHLNILLPGESRTERSTDLLENNHFRRTPRVLELVPLTVRGADLLGEEFETPSYTLNTSCRGACLLLPEKLVTPGQKIHLQNHKFVGDAEVRWVVQGKAGTMVFAGVLFNKPIHTAETPSDHDLAD